jgi:hypothetical protein
MTRPKRNPKKLSVIRAGLALSGLLVAVGLVAMATPSSAEKAVAAPNPAVDEASKQESSATAVFAGGCFWGVQGVFQHEGRDQRRVWLCRWRQGNRPLPARRLGNDGTCGISPNYVRPAADQLRAAVAGLFLGRP